MRTFFARRYMRRIELVGNTEKVLGILILLLVAAIVVAFVLQVGTNRDYLFNVDQETYAPAAPEPADAEAEAARSSAGEGENPFPDPGLEDWRLPSRVDRFTADNGRTVDVYWYDKGTPRNALGMYRSEQPPDAATIPIGRAGYQVGGSVFFCKASSYVQVLPSRPDDAAAEAALSIAEHLAERIEAK